MDEREAPPRERPRPWGVLLAAGLGWSALAGALTARLAGTSLDDFYITYRYAWNLAHGAGLVFNPGERVLGVTEPGMALWLALAHRATGLSIPLLGTATTGLALVALALLLLAAGLRAGHGWAAFAGGTLAVGSVYLWVCHGAAAPAVLALLVGAAAVAGRRPAWAGILAGAAVWLRPDAGLGVAALAALLAWENRRIPWRFLLPAAGVVAAGLAASALYFGELLPHTLAAKRVFAGWQGTRYTGLTFWLGARPLLRRFLSPSWPWLAGLGLLGVPSLLRFGGREGRTLAAWTALLFLAYPLLAVPFSPWYAVPAVACLLLALPWGMADAARAVAAWLGARRQRERPAVLAGLLFAAGCLLVLRIVVPTTLVWAAGAGSFPPHDTYRVAGQWLARHSRPGDRVTALEIGTIAYVSGRPVEDAMGLVTPRSLAWVARQDLTGGFRDRPTELLVIKPNLQGLLGPLLGQPWFRRRYREAARFPGEPGQWVSIYERRPALLRSGERSMPAPGCRLCGVVPWSPES